MSHDIPRFPRDELTPEHEAAFIRYWDAQIGGPINWDWLLQMDDETKAFLAKSPAEVATLWLDLPPRIRTMPTSRKSLFKRIWKVASEPCEVPLWLVVLVTASAVVHTIEWLA